MSSNRPLLPPEAESPAHRLVVERRMVASPDRVYWAWTEGFDTWFAEPGLIRMRPAIDEPFAFQTRHEGRITTHHGRFLRLDAGRLVELTWVTGAAGTDGAETVVTVELEPEDDGSRLRLTHAGFYDEAGVDRHESAWRDHVLPHLDDVLSPAH